MFSILNYQGRNSGNSNMIGVPLIARARKFLCSNILDKAWLEMSRQIRNNTSRGVRIYYPLKYFDDILGRNVGQGDVSHTIKTTYRAKNDISAFLIFGVISLCYI